MNDNRTTIVVEQDFLGKPCRSCHVRFGFVLGYHQVGQVARVGSLGIQKAVLRVVGVEVVTGCAKVRLALAGFVDVKAVFACC